MKEIWADIEGYEGLYEISNHGRVQSLERIIVNSNGVSKIVKAKILKPIINQLGYARVSLCKKGIKMKSARVHRLVALSFIPNPQNKKTVNHIDGNKLNNHIKNLEWATCSENCKHAYSIGLSKKPNPNKYGNSQGEKRSGSKLTDSDVRYIRKNARLNGGDLKISDLTSKFDVSYSQIYKIACRESWKHVI